jgi:hypothetical protein
MRIVILAATAVLAISYSAPAFAQARSYQVCWDLAEKSGATYGAPHHGLVTRCMAGSAVKGAPPKEKPSPQLRAEAKTYSACWALAEARGATPGAPHKTFVTNCMAGRQN